MIVDDTNATNATIAGNAEQTTKEARMTPKKRPQKGMPEATNGRKRQKLRQISVRVDDAEWNMMFAVNAKLGELEKRNLSFNYTFKRAMSDLYEKLHGKPFRAA